ncbi:hypothetical protein SporoP37_03805 [Sporosarcina sp. P37]|nr:hypothetical protein SporoP37_03805 [Sporosarcina sp. P37]PID17722.1 hypothetical protein CSV62_12145 [Sporosarcina sp. P35]
MGKENTCKRRTIQKVSFAVIMGSMAILLLLHVTGLATKFSVESLEAFQLGGIIISTLLLISSFFFKGK